MLSPSDFYSIRVLTPIHRDFKVVEFQAQIYCIRVQPELQPFYFRNEDKKRTFISWEHPKLTAYDLFNMDLAQLDLIDYYNMVTRFNSKNPGKTDYKIENYRKKIRAAERTACPEINCREAKTLSDKVSNIRFRR